MPPSPNQQQQEEYGNQHHDNMKIYIILAVIFVPLFLGLVGYVANDWFGEYTVELQNQGVRAVVVQIVQQIEQTGEITINTADKVYILIEKPKTPQVQP